MDIKIIIAAHKPYMMPNDKMYIPLHVGCEGKDSFGFQGDNTGDNISAKNPFFCELTGLYWAWKNLSADYIGLSHYIRHFCLKKKKDKFKSVLSFEQTKQILLKKPCILPKMQRYYIENLYDHYAHTHDASHLDAVRKILESDHPSYLFEFDRLKKITSAHMFNMMVMRSDIFNSYCEWVFDILFKLENKIDTSRMSSFDARLFGRISELLLDVWINTNSIEYSEVPIIYMERINWCKKISSFIKAKFFGKKYNKSF